MEVFCHLERILKEHNTAQHSTTQHNTAQHSEKHTIYIRCTFSNAGYILELHYLQRPIIQTENIIGLVDAYYSICRSCSQL